MASDKPVVATRNDNTSSTTSFVTPSPAGLINNALPPAYLECDLVIAFDTLSSNVPNEKKTTEAIEDAFRFLLAELVNAGFCFKVRVNKPGSVLIFVKASDAIVSIASYRSQIKDWLFGIRTSAPVVPESQGTLGDDFTTAERLRLVHDRLTNAPKDHGLGITPGQGNWVFVKSIFALHDPEFNVDWIKRWSTKWVLDDAELDIIKNAFGEKIALYFAFLQYYFARLLFPTIIGVVAFFFLPPYSPIFAIINCLWCCVFVESWKHREVELAVKWGVKGCSGLDTHRATFKGESERQDPITGTLVQYYPSWKRVIKQFTAIPTALTAGLMLMGVQAIVFAIEIFLSEIYDGPLKQYLVFLPTALLATLVPTFTAFYNIIATRMTDWENHATERTYETAMTQKMFVLNFLTSYMGLFLSSYVYLPFGHLIAPNMDFISATMERLIGEKASAKNFTINTLRLRQQYIYFTATAQLVNFFVETLLPYIQRRAFKEAKKLQEKVTGACAEAFKDNEVESPFLARVRAEVDFPDYEVGEDYREMVVQFGYLSLFATVWPLAPLFSFINNWVELRGDAVKICLDTKRPIPSKAETIGPWLDNLIFLTWLGSLTTSSLVSMYRLSPTDPDCPYLVSTRPWVLLATVLLSEHVYFAARYLIGYIYDALDSTVVQNYQRQKYINRQQTLKRSLPEAEPIETLEHDEMVLTEEERDEWRAAIAEAIVTLKTSLVKNEMDKKEE
ncbi:calcium-activated chloride channel-domain-containing protein [Lipomyces tetrasporus]|uniref:Calcium-activated chloride channel-domain-containing protein n=1 Tax=Lipomyces tetrasporus TaxID=54092 RepID=A0AAD7VWJ4_9ASCO|nr:calcium-activated chloride channel-domain-containing protein [Lipomyces tetrasporus]KAJ8104246.1 calcium-activated chloride channel-domain-containing protein [Lipomyces tetrasporus]